MEDNRGGTNALAQVIQSRMNEVVEANTQPICDFGSIQSDMSLLTNLYPVAMPYGTYVVCRQLTIGYEGDEYEETTEEEACPNCGQKHKHKSKLPKKMRKIQPGDRVLVVWVQNDPVVVDIIT